MLDLLRSRFELRLWKNGQVNAPRGYPGGLLDLEQLLADIETAEDVASLKSAMQRIAETFGFVSYNFIDAGRPHAEEPFWTGTTGADWESEYLGNNFVSVDPTLSLARRTNVPFTWKMVRQRIRTGPRSGAQQTMIAARDHGFRDGIVLPLHLKDRIGRPRSCCIGFFWTERQSMSVEVRRSLMLKLHILSLYWMQRMLDLVAAEIRKSHAIVSEDANPALISPKEKEVLSWLARGKILPEVAEIMHIGIRTAEWHARNARAKLDASTSTHAVTKAIFLGLIDV